LGGETQPYAQLVDVGQVAEFEAEDIDLLAFNLE
jgi:hypothetical protein